MTISIQVLALILMLVHIVSDIFMARVLYRQWGLFKVNYDDFGIAESELRDIKRFRVTLFTLSCIVFAGNVVPIIIDTITVLTDNSLHRNADVPIISLAYAVSNALTALISAYLIFTLYRIAKGSDNPNELLEKDIASRKK